MARICVTCRTRLDETDSCDLGAEHQVADLQSALQRRHLEIAVWGDRSRQLPLGRMLLAILAIITGVCAWQGVYVMVSVGIVSLLVTQVLIQRGVLATVTLSRARRLPTGVEEPDLTGHGWVGGQLHAVRSIRSPLSGRSAAAYGIAVLAKPGDAVLLLDGGCGGGQVRAESGDVVALARGRVRLADIVEHGTRFDDSDALKTYLDTVTGGRADLVPGTVARELLIEADTAVEVSGPFEERQLGDGYRDGTWAKAPVGTPVIRLPGAD